MPFLDSVDSIQTKAHASGVSNPALIGILVVVGLALCFFVYNMLSSASGAHFQLEESSSSMPAEGKLDDDTDNAASADPADNSILKNKGAGLNDVEGSDEEVVQTSRVVVFVSGCVNNPGVYELQEDARVGDAIDAAGGFASDAATDYNNLARLVVDAEQIHVPSLSDASVQALDTPDNSQIVSDVSTSPQGSTLVNINTASASELETLPGIGPATAAKIVSNRETDGPFASIEELMRVSGIGKKKYASLEGLICV